MTKWIVVSLFIIAIITGLIVGCIPTPTPTPMPPPGFNPPITSAASPLSVTGGQVSIPAASATQNGYTASADWNIFNNKQSSFSVLPEASVTNLVSDLASKQPAFSTLPEASITGLVSDLASKVASSSLTTDFYYNRTIPFMDIDTPTSGPWTPAIQIPNAGIITGVGIYTSTVGATISQIQVSYMSSAAYTANGNASSSGWTSILTTPVSLGASTYSAESTMTNIIYATQTAFPAGTYFRANVVNLDSTIRGLVTELRFKSLLRQ